MSKSEIDNLAAVPGASNQSPAKKKRAYGHHPTYMDEDGLSYIFRRENKTTKEIVAECPNKQCKGQARVAPGQALIRTREHTSFLCIPEKRNIPTKALKSHLKEIVPITGLTTRKSFEAAQQKFPDALPLAYNSMARNLCRLKAKKNPPNPANLEEYVMYLQQDEWKEMLNYDKGHLQVEFIKGEEDFEAAIFGDPQFVTKLLLTAHDGIDLFMDGTFDSIPNLPNLMQLLIIHACRYNHVLPIAYSLMTRKTGQAYEGVLKHVFTVIAPQLPSLQSNVHLDFEKAERNTVKKLLPMATVVLSHTHFERAQLRQALKKGAVQTTKLSTISSDPRSQELKIEIGIRKSVTSTLNLIMALPLAREGDVKELYATIKEDIQNEAAEQRMGAYFDYFEDTWMTKCPPSEWSVFDAIRRTNNPAESRNRSINADFAKHSHPWKFTRDLTRLQSTIANDFEAIQAGKSRQRVRTSDHIKEAFIQKQQKLLTENHLKPYEFLEQMATCINFEAKYKRAGGDVGDDVEITLETDEELPSDLEMLPSDKVEDDDLNGDKENDLPEYSEKELKRKGKKKSRAEKKNRYQIEKLNATDNLSLKFVITKR